MKIVFDTLSDEIFQRGKSTKFKSNCLIDNHNLQFSLYIMHLMIFVSKIKDQL